METMEIIQNIHRHDAYSTKIAPTIVPSTDQKEDGQRIAGRIWVDLRAICNRSGRSEQSDRTLLLLWLWHHLYNHAERGWDGVRGAYALKCTQNK